MSCRVLLLVPALCALAVSPLAAATSTSPAPAAATASSGWSLSAADRAGVRALVEQAFALGMPDPKGGEFRTGTLRLQDKPDPQRMHSGFDVFSRWVEPNEKPGFSMVYENDTSIWTGVHLRLPDGTWLAHLTTPVGKDADDSGIDAQHVEPAQLVDEVLKRFPKRMRAQALRDDRSMPDAMAPYFQAVRALQPLTMLTETSRFRISDDAPRAIPAELLFLRLGLPDAELMLLGSSMHSVFGSDDDVARAAPLTLGNDQHMQQHLVRGMPARSSDLSQERLAERLAALKAAPLLRKTLIAWFTAELIDGDAGWLKTDRAIAALRSLTGAGSDVPADEARRVELLIARAALPATVAADAPLAARLALWQPRDPNHHFTHIDDDDLARMSPQKRAQVLAYRTSAIVFTDAERDGIVALLGDTGPSGWLDGNEHSDQRQPRTLGDNALRYLASDFGCDPRLLIGRDVAAPWTDAERADTAKAFATWWAANKSKPKDELISAVIGDLPLRVALPLIEKKPKTERAGLIAKIAAAWARVPPDADTNTLAKALRLFAEDAEIRRIVLAWPVTGERRLVLAVFHDLHGDAAPLDAAIQAGFAAGNQRQGFHDIDADTAIGLCAARPTPERLQRLLTIAAGALDDPTTVFLLRQALFSHRISMPYQVRDLFEDSTRMRMRMGNKPDDGKEYAVARALTATFLADTRTLPPGMVSIEVNDHGQNRNYMLKVRTKNSSMSTNLQDNELPVSAKAPDGKLEARADWRVCDFAARALVRGGWHLGLDMDQRRGAPAFDLFAAPADRDTRIGALRTSFTPRVLEALKAAGLSANVPGETPVNQDKDALF